MLKDGWEPHTWGGAGACPSISAGNQERGWLKQYSSCFQCVGVSAKLGRLGRCCREQGARPQRERGAPWHSDQSWGFIGGVMPVPSQRQDGKGVSYPLHGLLYSAQQPCQMHDIPISQTRRLRPRKIQRLCPKLQCRWHSWGSGLVPSTAPRLAPDIAMVTSITPPCTTCTLGPKNLKAGRSRTGQGWRVAEGKPRITGKGSASEDRFGPSWLSGREVGRVGRPSTR